MARAGSFAVWWLHGGFLELGAQHRVRAVLKRPVSGLSACGEGGDGLVVVPLGARELRTVEVGGLFPVLAVLQEAGEGSGAGMGKRGPVVMAEVPRGVHRAVGGENGLCLRRRGERESQRMPSRARVGPGDPVASRPIAMPAQPRTVPQRTTPLASPTPTSDRHRGRHKRCPAQT